MKFKLLKEKCDYFRSISDYRLVPNSYIIAMLDGRKFSSLIKNKYEKPFDNVFIDMMNETAKYLLQNIQGAKFAYVQSDEISILITDFDTPQTDAFFSYRLCKMQSIMASMAASKFNQLALRNEIMKTCYTPELTTYDTLKHIDKVITGKKLVEFDCKCWNVPNANEAYCHFLWRQHDCVRNSKQQAAQTYLPHKSLVGLDTDAQVKLLLDEKGINWNDYESGKKYGRLITKELMQYHTLIKGEVVNYQRNEWIAHGARPFDEPDALRPLIDDIGKEIELLELV